MTLLQAIGLAVAGLGAGFVAGLVGVGGGVVFTPVLFAVYGVLDVPEAVRTPLTVGTGLFCTGLAAGASAVHHVRRGAVRPRMAVGVGLASVGAVGLVSGLVVTQPWYDSSLFQLFFAAVLLVVVVRMVRGPAADGSRAEEADDSLVRWPRWLGTGTAAGTVASAVGVGGGVVLVPAYSRLLRLPFHRAVGTSSATILVISALSTVAYAWLGAGLGVRPVALGYVDVGTGLLLAGPAVFGAQGCRACASGRDGLAAVELCRPRGRRGGAAGVERHCMTGSNARRSRFRPFRRRTASPFRHSPRRSAVRRRPGPQHVATASVSPMSLYQKLFAHGLALGDDVQHRIYGERKRQLFTGVEGTVVEIGPGTGVNLPYLPDGLRWIGLEPNPHMHSYLHDRLAGRNLDVDLRPDPAQDTGLPTDCADVVISTLVLCSVPSLDDTLAELRRILKPGGRLLFIEHVAAPHDTWLYTLQRGIRPVWTRLADGCHPNRKTGRALQQAGFSSVSFERFDADLPVVSPHVIGAATV